MVNSRATLFSVELLALLDAGLNLVEALRALAERQSAGERQAVLAGLVAALARGEPFSRALALYPRHFPPVYVATLKAAERTGSVRDALARYIAYQEEFDKVRRRVVSAAIYPAILSVVGTLVLAFLVFYVVPRFARVYEDISGTLPMFSKLLLLVGRSVQDHGSLLVIFFLVTTGLIAWSLRRATVRAWLADQLWRIPALGERMKVYQLARLYRTSGMLMRAGIPALRALEMARDLLAAHLRPRLARARELIGEGHALSAAFATAGLATPIALRMLAVGERGGDMGRMMERIACFHDDEVARYVDWFARAFEPLLMAALGIAVGLVVVLMYMPIFELAGSLQ